jgi:beta-1,4-mannosyl-glycoprotein beta-1,4-N-acetylglucosaminyltransferase
VYDCFTFFNEIELLKVRIEELYDVVDYFVVTEATQTFTGEPKRLHFLDHAEEFAKYKEKIIHLIVDDFPAPTSNHYQDRWTREAFQRNAAFRGLNRCTNDDIIFISDVDEIPNQQAVRQVKEYFHRVRVRGRNVRDENQWICQLDMRLFLFFLNYEGSRGWNGAAKAAPFWMVKKMPLWNLKILHHTNPHLHQIHNGGWHFHSMVGGDNEKLALKLRSAYLYEPQKDFCFGVSNDWVANLSNVETWEGHTEDFVKWSSDNNSCQIVPVDDSYPKYILDHIEHFKDLGWLKQ